MSDPIVRAGPPPVRGPASAGPGGWRATLAGALVRTARPKQWIKNVLVFAVPGAAGVLGEARPLTRSVLIFAVFCLAASGTYFLNDRVDLSADRCHRTKRLRPVAAGVAYTLWLKHEAILDLAAVAAGFVLRAVAGGIAVGVPISEWFLIVAMFGSLFMVAGRRSAELRALGDRAGSSRATLAVYSASFLRFILVMSSTITVTAYCLWAFENHRADRGGIWFQLSIVPFALAVLRYAYLLDQGLGSSPEDVVLADRSLQVLGLLWVLFFGIGVYG
jgi:decaprenyl-phosphate phosphoribosyltransferase